MLTNRSMIHIKKVSKTVIRSNKALKERTSGLRGHFGIGYVQIRYRKISWELEGRL